MPYVNLKIIHAYKNTYKDKDLGLSLKGTRKNDLYLETLLFGIAPHFLIMTGLAINAIDHDEREVSVVDLFLE